MFATGLIVFRETLEAALFIGIVAAATIGVPRRGLWLGVGVMAGCWARSAWPQDLKPSAPWPMAWARTS